MFQIIDPAYAQSAGSTGGFDFVSLLPLVLIFVAFYFFLIRPQQKKAQQQREMISAIKVGDQVVTAGGIIGVVDKVEETQFVLKVEDGTRMRFVKSAISEKINNNLKAPASKTQAENIAPLKPARTKGSVAQRKITPRKSPKKG